MAFAGMNSFSTPQGSERYVRVQWLKDTECYEDCVPRWSVQGWWDVLRSPRCFYFSGKSCE